jgi:hypothetical protein
LIEDAAVRKAAKASLEKLKAGLANAIVEARRLVDESIKHIDEKKKSTMNEWDLQNIYHIHGDRPQYRTATSSTTDIQQLASAILEGGRQRQAPEIDIAAIVAKAVADATAPLAAKLEAYEAKKAELEVKEQVLDKATSVVEQIKAKKDGK